MPLPIMLAGVIGELARQGLTLLGNAVLVKGKEVIERETGVKLGADMPPEDLLKLKQFELEHEEELAKLKAEDNRIELEYFQAELGDKQSARDREVNMAKINSDSGQPWYVPSITTVLAFVVVVGGGWVLQGTEADTDVKFTINTMMTLVLGFYFGTTRGSSKKDDTISRLTDGGGK